MHLINSTRGKAVRDRLPHPTLEEVGRFLGCMLVAFISGGFIGIAANAVISALVVLAVFNFLTALFFIVGALVWGCIYLYINETHLDPEHRNLMVATGFFWIAIMAMSGACGQDILAYLASIWS